MDESCHINPTRQRGFGCIPRWRVGLVCSRNTQADIVPSGLHILFLSIPLVSTRNTPPFGKQGRFRRFTQLEEMRNLGILNGLTSLISLAAQITGEPGSLVSNTHGDPAWQCSFSPWGYGVVTNIGE